jgi:hypothetical protein
MTDQNSFSHASLVSIQQQYVWNMESQYIIMRMVRILSILVIYLDVPGSSQPCIVAGTCFLLLLSEMEAFDAQE